MSKVDNDPLFRLIKTLTKAEKRQFKLYATRAKNDKDLKFIQLFDILDQSAHYDEQVILQKAPALKASQLSNLKAHLYRQILKSLRLLELNQNPDIEIRENIDYARVLYNKGLYVQSLKILEKAKQKTIELYEDALHLEIVDFEKLIESQYITHSMDNRAELLSKEATSLAGIIDRTQQLSNLALSLYSLYLKVGCVRNENDFQMVSRYYFRNLPQLDLSELTFYERLYLYQSQVWYYYIIQDFVKCYRYAQAWVDLFHQHPHMREIKPDLYVKGLHNLLAALFYIQHYTKFVVVLDELEALEGTHKNDNINLLVFVYSYNNRINRHFMEGRFEEGLALVPTLTKKMTQLQDKFDQHRLLLFYYKIACLYFGSGDFKTTVHYLNIIINSKEQGIREDIHCFARILNLIAHYELGNNDLLEYQIKSTYRFLVKMDSLQKVQIEIIKWLRNTPKMTENEVREAFINLKQKLEDIAREPFELRPFLYLDIISWLESKIEHLPVQEVIRRKFLAKHE